MGKDSNNMKSVKSKYPNTFYRVSTKAIIRNEHGEVLVARENPEIWNLVGGGIDHGETAHESLARELYEEALITEPFDARIEGIDARLLESLGAYYMWIVYTLTFANGTPHYGVGPDAHEVAFVDPRDFHESPHLTERMIYKWTCDRTYDIYATYEK